MLYFFVVVIVVAFFVYGAKMHRKKVKKKFICYCFCSFFLYARALGACGAACVPALVLVVVACVPVFAGAPAPVLVFRPDLVASCAILLTSAKMGAHAHTRIHAYPHTHIHAQ